MRLNEEYIQLTDNTRQWRILLMRQCEAITLPLLAIRAIYSLRSYQGNKERNRQIIVWAVELNGKDRLFTIG